MKYSNNKTIHQIVKKLLKMGWVVKAKNAHVKLFHPERKVTLMVPGSPSDGRAVLNFIADVKRAGFAV